MQLVHARARRRFSRGLKRKPLALMKKLRKAKKEAPALEKPAVVKTHLRNMIVLPDMIGSIVGVHNGKTFNQVEIKVLSSDLVLNIGSSCCVILTFLIKLFLKIKFAFKMLGMCQNHTRYPPKLKVLLG